MSYTRTYVGRRAAEEEWTFERIARLIFTLGFVREQVQGSDVLDQGQALEDCGAVIPWVTTLGVLIWSQVYGMGFVATLGFLEAQAALIGVVTAAFVPRRTPLMLLNLIVNVFVALLATFLLLIVGAFALGLALLILSEG